MWDKEGIFFFFFLREKLGDYFFRELFMRIG
jgi:hypothetical protein